MPPGLKPSDYILCPQRILFYFVWFSEKIPIISLCITNRLAFIIPKESVYCAVRNKHLNKIHGIFHLQKLKPILIFLERKFSLFNQNPRTTDKINLNYSKRRWEAPPPPKQRAIPRHFINPFTNGISQEGNKLDTFHTEDDCLLVYQF
jgi:hypothetical protein